MTNDMTIITFLFILQVLVTGGAYESLFCSFQGLIDPGDEVLNILVIYSWYMLCNLVVKLARYKVFLLRCFKSSQDRSVNNNIRPGTQCTTSAYSVVKSQIKLKCNLLQMGIVFIMLYWSLIGAYTE